MSLYHCEVCGCIENTATSNYWQTCGKGKEHLPKLCSECDPEIGKWHGRFPKESADGMLLGNDGFLYSKEHDESGQLDWRKRHQGFAIVGVVGEKEGKTT